MKSQPVGAREPRLDGHRDPGGAGTRPRAASHARDETPHQLIAESARSFGQRSPQAAVIRQTAGLQGTAGNAAVVRAMTNAGGSVVQRRKIVKERVVERIGRYDEIIERVSAELGINPNIVRGIIAAESAGKPRARGAGDYKGLMQAKFPERERKRRERAGESLDYFDPETSIRAGIMVYQQKARAVERFLERQGLSLDDLGSDAEVMRTVLIAYNGGQETVRRAMLWAIESGDLASWHDRRHYVRALMSTGAYAVKYAYRAMLRREGPEQLAALLASTGASVEEIRAAHRREDGGWNRRSLLRAVVRSSVAQLKSHKQLGRGSGFRASSYPTLAEIAEKSPLALHCADWKYGNQTAAGGYLDKPLAYKAHFEGKPAPTAGRPGVESDDTSAADGASPDSRTGGGDERVGAALGGLAVGVATTIVTWLGGTSLDRSVVRGVLAMGVRGEKDLTNLLFWAQHPEAAFRRIRADEKELAAAWIRIRDTVVRPALRGDTEPEQVRDAPAKTEPAGPVPATGGAVGTGGVGPENLGGFGDKGATEFRKEVLRRQRAWSSRRHEFFPGVPPDDLEVVEGRHRLHQSAADDARALLAQARADLQADQAAGKELANKVKSIGIASAYRDPKRDFRAWQNAFRTHYRRTAAKRASLPGGPCGEAAIKLMFKIMRRKKAPPGFSNHTHGLAIDFQTTQGKWTLGASSAQAKGWPNTWLWQWLNDHAATHNFHPYKKEPWHWNHHK